ncbi:MAG: succinylglutamate desuccinylase [Candidatus Zixiibacteriota bacterium]
MQRNHITAIVILIIALTVSGIAANEFLQMHQSDLLIPSPSLTRIGSLGDYFAKIKGGHGDTPIYYFESGKPGATVLLLGGTHPNEPAGFIAATLILENLRVTEGRVIIIPQACYSAFTCTDPFEGYPQYFHINAKSGIRKFRFGSRVCNPLDQWPDPLVYSHYPSGQQLSGFESRNLNRSYPGRRNGTFSEQTGHAIMQLIKQENVTVAFDFHEAAPEIPIINAIVYHEKGEEIALTTVFSLEFEELRYAPESSPVNFRGLSHREWGDNFEVIPFLMETSNPIQGRLRGKTDENLILKGISPEYKTALESGALRIEYKPDGEPLAGRVGRHVQGFKSILESYNEFNAGNKVIIENIPSYNDIVENGIGNYLN